MTAPDPFPDINPFSNDNIRFAKNLADILVPSGRDRPRPEQQVVSLSEYNALLGEFEHMKNTANKAIETCRFLEADRDAAYDTISHLREAYNVPLSADALNNMIDTQREHLLLERGQSYRDPSKA